jgi:hypothetical protein
VSRFKIASNHVVALRLTIRDVHLTQFNACRGKSRIALHGMEKVAIRATKIEKTNLRPLATKKRKIVTEDSVFQISESVALRPKLTAWLIVGVRISLCEHPGTGHVLRKNESASAATH